MSQPQISEPTYDDPETIPGLPLDKLCELAAHLKSAIRELESHLDPLEAEIRRRTLAKEDSIMTEYLRTSIVPPGLRETWDSQFLKGLAVTVPAIMSACRTKHVDPSVRIVYLKGD